MKPKNLKIYNSTTNFASSWGEILFLIHKIGPDIIYIRSFNTDVFYFPSARIVIEFLDRDLQITYGFQIAVRHFR